MPRVVDISSSHQNFEKYQDMYGCTSKNNIIQSWLLCVVDVVYHLENDYIQIDETYFPFWVSKKLWTCFVLVGSPSPYFFNITQRGWNNHHVKPHFRVKPWHFPAFIFRSSLLLLSACTKTKMQINWNDSIVKLWKIYHRLKQYEEKWDTYFTQNRGEGSRNVYLHTLPHDCFLDKCGFSFTIHLWASRIHHKITQREPGSKRLP